MKVIVVTNSWDKAKARILVEVISNVHGVDCALWDHSRYLDNEHQLKASQAVISVGGPLSNNVTREFQSVVRVVYEDDDISIEMASNKAIVYDKGWFGINTEKAVRRFINYHLDGFLKSLKSQ